MARESKAVINTTDLKLDHWKQGEFYESVDTSFGTLLGLAGLGVSYNEVPPGKSGCPFHNHHVEDELFYVIAGAGEYRFGEERHAIKTGDVRGAPAGGPETAPDHQHRHCTARLSRHFDDGEDRNRRISRFRKVSGEDQQGHDQQRR